MLAPLRGAEARGCLLWQVVVVGGKKKAEELLLRVASGRNRVRTKMRYRVLFDNRSVASGICR